MIGVIDLLDEKLFDRKELTTRPMGLEQLKPGMRLGSTIWDNNGNMLLKAGVELNEKYIDFLTKMQIDIVGVSDEGYDYNVPEVQDVIDTETRQAAIEQVKNVLIGAKESGRLVIEPESLYSTVGELTGQLLGNRHLIYNLIDLRTQDDYTFAHSVNVCVLSLMTGITMGYTEEELSELGVGSLLHDLGKIKIPDEILNKPSSLTKEEFEVMKTHTTHGYELIQAAGNLDENHAQMAVQHHENFDGSGYPMGLTGMQISEYAQVIAIADRFDAITANRVYRKSFPPFEAFAVCQAAANYYVKEAVARAFIYNIAAYPANTVVELNNGMIGISMDTPKGSSLFPLVRVYYDENKKPLMTPFDLPLYDAEGIFVVRVIDNYSSTKE